MKTTKQAEPKIKVRSFYLTLSGLSGINPLGDQTGLFLTSPIMPFVIANHNREFWVTGPMLIWAQRGNEGAQAVTVPFVKTFMTYQKMRLITHD